MDTKFGANVSNRMLLNAAKFQGYSFSVFELLKLKLFIKIPPCRIFDRLLHSIIVEEKNNF